MEDHRSSHGTMGRETMRLWAMAVRVNILPSYLLPLHRLLRTPSRKHEASIRESACFVDHRAAPDRRCAADDGHVGNEANACGEGPDRHTTHCGEGGHGSSTHGLVVLVLTRAAEGKEVTRTHEVERFA